MNTNMVYYREIKPHFKKRIVWYIINHTIFRVFFYGKLACKCRNSILRFFGATIHEDACVYPTCNIFAPWNLFLGRSCIGPNTRIYNKDKVQIGDDCIISQGAYLCTASHDIERELLPLITEHVTIKDQVWVAADAFIGMGVTIGQGAVVGARAAVFKDVEPWTVVGGNPARVIKRREIKDFS